MGIALWSFVCHLLLGTQCAPPAAIASAPPASYVSVWSGGFGTVLATSDRLYLTSRNAILVFDHDGPVERIPYDRGLVLSIEPSTDGKRLLLGTWDLDDGCTGTGLPRFMGHVVVLDRATGRIELARRGVELESFHWVAGSSSQIEVVLEPWARSLERPSREVWRL
jgi:hypothetical protein